LETYIYKKQKSLGNEKFRGEFKIFNHGVQIFISTHLQALFFMLRFRKAFITCVQFVDTHYIC